MTLFDVVARGLQELRGKRLTAAQREDRLAAYLYWHHHTAADGWVGSDAAGDRDFVTKLIRSAEGARCFEEGWWVSQVTAKGLAAYNSFVTLWVPRRKGAWSPARLRRRQKVQLSFPCAREGAMPGYLLVMSRAGRAVQRHHAKLYLNLKPEGASAWVALLVHDPELRRVRFDAKLFNHPLAYGRRDTAMMYFGARDLGVVMRVMRRFVRQHPRWVRDEHVPFTFVVDRGLSVGASLEAEASSRVSYGELRCRLVARGVLRALKRGLPRERWLNELRREFAKAGGDFDRPWLGVAKIATALKTAGQPWPPGRPGGAARRG